MSAVTKVSCDGCGFDLTDTGNSQDWRITLRQENVPAHGGSVTDMYFYPPLPDGPYHFCGLPCLDKWRATIPAKARA